MADKRYPEDYPFRVVIAETGKLALAYATREQAEANLARMNAQAEELGISARYELVQA